MSDEQERTQMLIDSEAAGEEELVGAPLAVVLATSLNDSSRQQYSQAIPIAAEDPTQQH